MDYKEYSRLRSIARKRIERAAAAGKIEKVEIPTVAQVRRSADPEAFLKGVKAFLNTPGAGLSWLKADENLSFPRLELPEAPPNTKLSAEQKAERRRRQNRLSKARARIRKEAGTPEEAKKKASYLKGLNTLISKWEAAGLDAGKWIKGMTPKQLQSFADYIDYRFSQGDYTVKYSIDTFIKDFGEMVKQNYNLENIQMDFGVFLDKQKKLSKNRKQVQKYGITEDFVDAVWKKFVGRK